MVARALAAPSPLNIQPWMVRFPVPDRIELCIDPGRILPALDPDFRRIFIAHGAFLENLDIAARDQGYRTDITLFPSGWPGARLDLSEPVARIDLIRDTAVEKDPLAAVLFLRRTSRIPFSGRSIGQETLAGLSDSYDQSAIPMGLLTDPGSRSAIAALLYQATAIELSGEDRFRELLLFLDTTCRSDRRAGCNLTDLGLSSLSLVWLRLRMALVSGDRREALLKETLISCARRQASTAAGFGWITTPGNLRVEQIRAGRAFERVALTAASLGLSFQPMTQILSDYPGMEDLRNNLYDFLGIPRNRTIQMFFRIGYAAPVPATPRRPVGTVIR
ncbi:MAG: hypothetical protein GKC07_08865 [Methanomicrobiales archaeon]|nr:hypothetical protein [Methanomicrobiales archaeon]